MFGGGWVVFAAFAGVFEGVFAKKGRLFVVFLW
jgi:hypothetical protein